MKTAVSIPDSIYRVGETLAERQGMTRSEVYAQGILALARRLDGRLIEDSYNAAYPDHEDATPGPLSHSKSQEIDQKLERGEW